MKLDNQIYDGCDSRQALEKIECLLWVNHLLDSRNPVLVQLAFFLATNYEIDLDQRIEATPPFNESSLSPLEVYEAQLIEKYFSNHSNIILDELSRFIPQWMEME